MTFLKLSWKLNVVEIISWWAMKLLIILITSYKSYKCFVFTLYEASLQNPSLFSGAVLSTSMQVTNCKNVLFGQHIQYKPLSATSKVSCSNYCYCWVVGVLKLIVKLGKCVVCDKLFPLKCQFKTSYENSLLHRCINVLCGTNCLIRSAI